MTMITMAMMIKKMLFLTTKTSTKIPMAMEQETTLIMTMTETVFRIQKMLFQRIVPNKVTTTMMALEITPIQTMIMMACQISMMSSR